MSRAQNMPVRDLLTPDEEERMRRETPRPAPRTETTLADVADVVESTLRTRLGNVPVVVEPTLAALRRGGVR